MSAEHPLRFGGDFDLHQTVGTGAAVEVRVYTPPGRVRLYLMYGIGCEDATTPLSTIYIGHDGSGGAGNQKLAGTAGAAAQVVYVLNYGAPPKLIVRENDWLQWNWSSTTAASDLHYPFLYIETDMSNWRELLEYL